MICGREVFYLKRTETRDGSMDTLLEDLQQALDSAIEGMTNEQMGWHPTGKWCAAEVLEHSVSDLHRDGEGFERVFEAGKPMAGRASMRHRWRSLVVFSLTICRKVEKAPKQTVPRGLPVEKVRAEYRLKLEAMDEIIARCEARFGRGRLLDHPILGPLTAAQWRRFHWIHGRHHVKQIERLREQARAKERRPELGAYANENAGHWPAFSHSFSGSKWSFLLAHGGRNSGFSGFFLHVVELLLGIFDSFLLVGNLLFEVGILLIPLTGVT
jgi:hypothetical protein